MQMNSNRIYHFRDTPWQVGFAMGQAIGERLARNIDLYVSRRPPRPDAVDMDKLRTGALPWLRSLPARFQEEFEFAIFECACSDYLKRMPEGHWLIGTNHAVARGANGPSENSLARYCRVEELVRALWAKGSLKIPTDLIAILADDGVEARHADHGTVYANVACPGSGEIWYTLGGYPAASNGHWQRVAVPWERG